ncbi:hypothetical protein IM792_20910 [Mucilaginibacter sp. JRF]|uniref:hypothetical protein n=1 Tax=Mucilaginibacter sp. JRF TaxID=2780088 RepID=UPI0018812532|nr:hypothetical protein [Mucilaginibacter sp. JRF]MBE9586923.1 hypothetical protein [Mucilaginibacter sp. JRF]
MRKNTFLIVCLLVLNALAISAQGQTLNGVYAGAQLYNTPYNGMQIDNIVVYFRTDGTYSDKLNVQNWKTNVSGKYSVKSSIVQFGDKKYKLSANGNLESTSGIKHTLHKLRTITTIPASAYERQTASSSGGMGTGMPNVAAFSSDYLYFDGKGRFSADRSGTVGIGGDVAGGTIGGKSNSNSSAQGTYKLSAGEITLTYSNGKVAKHSFFYSPPNQEDMIVMNGDFYFREEGKKAAPDKRTATTTTATEKTDDTEENSALPTPAQLLGKLRTQYGGVSIDKINTVKETATITGNLEATTLTDVAANKLRLEIKQNGRLIMIKQLEGTTGWQWASGVKTPLTEQDKADMTLGLYQGILGLHKNLNKYFAAGTVTRSKDDDYLVTFNVKGNKVIYMLDAAYNLKANGYSLNGANNFSVYDKFVKASGISYPSVTESSDGKSSIVITTTDIKFNPALTADDWIAP